MKAMGGGDTNSVSVVGVKLHEFVFGKVSGIRVASRCYEVLSRLSQSIPAFPLSHAPHDACLTPEPETVSPCPAAATTAITTTTTAATAATRRQYALRIGG